MYEGRKQKNTTAWGAAPRGIYPLTVYRFRPYIGTGFGSRGGVTPPLNVSGRSASFGLPPLGRKSCAAQARVSGGFLDGTDQPTSFCVMRPLHQSRPS